METLLGGGHEKELRPETSLNFDQRGVSPSMPTTVGGCEKSVTRTKVGESAESAFFSRNSIL